MNEIKQRYDRLRGAIRKYNYRHGVSIPVPEAKRDPNKNDLNKALREYDKVKQGLKSMIFQLRDKFHRDLIALTFSADEKQAEFERYKWGKAYDYVFKILSERRNDFVWAEWMMTTGYDKCMAAIERFIYGSKETINGYAYTEMESILKAVKVGNDWIDIDTGTVL